MWRAVRFWKWLGEWSGWSLCSISCGVGGVKRRFRLLTREVGDRSCSGEDS